MTREERLQIFCAALTGILASGESVGVGNAVVVDDAVKVMLEAARRFEQIESQEGA